MSHCNFKILRFLRKEHAMTIHDLARASKVSYAVISKLERNQTNPSLSTLSQLAQALAISVTELVAMAENHTNETRREETYSLDGFDFRKIQYNNSALICVNGRKGSRLSRPEVHENDTEIVFVKEGKIRLTLPLGDSLLKKGESMQFDAVFPHTYEVMADCEMIILHLRKEKRF